MKVEKTERIIKEFRVTIPKGWRIQSDSVTVFGETMWFVATRGWRK